MTAHAQALPRAALLQMIVGACAISTTSIFVKYAHVGPTLSGFYRMAFGGLMLLGWLLATRQWRPLRWSDIGWLLLPGAAFAVDLVMWHRSILYVGPGLATLLGNFQVFLMALAGFVLYREKLGWQFLAGIARVSSTQPSTWPNKPRPSRAAQLCRSGIAKLSDSPHAITPSISALIRVLTQSSCAGSSVTWPERCAWRVDSM
jgi:hypothetical protein